jgi:hypothetical protein
MPCIQLANACRQARPRRLFCAPATSDEAMTRRGAKSTSASDAASGRQRPQSGCRASCTRVVWRALVIPLWCLLPAHSDRHGRFLGLAAALSRKCPCICRKSRKAARCYPTRLEQVVRRSSRALFTAGNGLSALSIRTRISSWCCWGILRDIQDAVAFVQRKMPPIVPRSQDGVCRLLCSEHMLCIRRAERATSWIDVAAAYSVLWNSGRQ